MQRENNTITVMVVDDTAANLKLLGTILHTQGYRVVQFPGGSMALTAAAKNPPDIMLLDIMMPDMDGFEVCRRMKADPLLAAVPIIFISAVNDIDHKVQAFAEGGVDYITKPFQEAEVLARVNTHIRLRRTLQDLKHQQGCLEQRIQERTADLLQAQRLARIGGWKLNSPEHQIEWIGETYRLFGLPDHQAVPYEESLQNVHPEDRSNVLQAWQAAQHNPQQRQYSIEYRLVINGSLLWIKEKTCLEFDDTGQFRSALGTVQDISEQKTHQAQLDYITHYDALTGLPNRTAFVEHLRQAMEHCRQTQTALAVAYVDLDDLIAINQTYGRDVGDQLILALSRRMVSLIPKHHHVARIGGDEFVVLLVGSDEQNASTVKQLLQTVAQPVIIGAHDIVITASVGMTRFPQGRETEADQLLRQADQAMYQAKLAGKNRYCLFDSEHDAHTRESYQRIEEIRQALARREFVLYYQPKVHLRSGKLAGFEALIRWQHPERGLLPPGVFIPLLDQHPLSIALGDWVIEAALEQLQQWQDMGLDTVISVNVDSLQLHDPGFITRLEQQLQGHANLRPHRLEMEILETGAINDIARASSLISRLHSMGVGSALDDFGTGYSSLTFLKQLPTDTVKIDQSFVRQMLSDAEHVIIIHSILGLARSFNRQIIAEGIETEVHGRLLLELGCEFGQGYAIAKPMAAAAVPEWLAHWHPPSSWRNSTARTVSEVLTEIQACSLNP